MQKKRAAPLSSSKIPIVRRRRRLRPQMCEDFRPRNLQPIGGYKAFFFSSVKHPSPTILHMARAAFLLEKKPRRSALDSRSHGLPRSAIRTLRPRRFARVLGLEAATEPEHRALRATAATAPPSLAQARVTGTTQRATRPCARRRRRSGGAAAARSGCPARSAR